LAVAVSVYSSFKEMPVLNKSVFIGELGLSGEVKKIDNIEKRIKEIERLGFTSCVIPKNSKDDIKIKFNKIKISEIEHVREIKKFF
jgi:DNA repair protein RadA/Sms